MAKTIVQYSGFFGSTGRDRGENVETAANTQAYLEGLSQGKADCSSVTAASGIALKSPARKARGAVIAAPMTMALCDTRSPAG